MEPLTTQQITRKVTITNAQILALNTTPVELLPAPGVNRITQIVTATAYTRGGTTPFINSEYLLIKQGGLHQVMQNGFALTAINQTSTFHAFDNAGEVNAATTLEAYETNPEEGDSEMDIYITYFIIDLI